MNRQHFIRTGLLAGSALIWSTAQGRQPLAGQQDDPQLDKTLVQTFVGAGHRDLSKVKEMLEEYPNLLNSAHDWKYGDFETCLGAASHVGFKEMAQFLVDKGAQANIFTATLFGKLDILKLYLTAFPAALHAKGPHGYTLLHHANQGEDEALEVKEYLVALGANETRIPLY